MTDKYRVIWSNDAIQHLEAIVAYIEVFDERAAVKMAERLRATAMSLTRLPHRGRPAAGGSRELTSVPPYIMRYRVIGNEVRILRIRHGRLKPTD